MAIPKAKSASNLSPNLSWQQVMAELASDDFAIEQNSIENRC